MTWRATLGGVELPFGVSWELAYGAGPVARVFELKTSRAQELWQRAQVQFPDATRTRERGAEIGPLTWVLENPDTGESVEIQGLYALELGPGSVADLDTKTILVADRRWLAYRVVVERTYNMRRASGDRRLVSGALEPVQLGESVADVQFQRATLYEQAVPWTASAVDADVLDEVYGPDGWGGIVAGPADDVESLVLADQGEEGLARILGLVPGTEVYAAPNGLVQTANAYDGSEVQVLEVADLVRHGEGGTWAVVDRSPKIPRVFRVGFVVECELRFNGSEGSTQNITPGQEARLLENVILCPLLSLTLADGSNATIGEPVELSDFLAAINLILPGSAPPVTVQALREVRNSDWVGWTQQYLIEASSGGTLETWDAILSALHQHWRQTWRILPQWMDKIRNLSARRLAILDAENASRGRSSVFTQWIQVLKQLGMAPEFGARGALLNNNYTDDLATATRSAPFEIKIRDAEVGIFQLIPRVDEQGLAQTYILGTCDEIPSQDIAEAAALWGHIPLSSTFDLAVVLAATKDVPATERRLHWVEVSLEDAAARLGVATPNASGPVYEIRATEETARFAWIDDLGGQVDEAFFSGDDLPAELLLNGDSLQAVALAHAARALAPLVPRAEGTVTRRLMPTAEPTGNLRRVVHELTADGVARTTLICPGDYTPPTVWSLLPEGVRRVLRAQVDRRTEP